jgi:type I restriction enzyme M protein
MNHKMDSSDKNIIKRIADSFNLREPINSFKTRIGLAFISWLKHSKKYDTSKLKLIINGNGRLSIKNIKKNIMKLEKEHPELENLMTRLLSRILDYPEDVDVDEVKNFLKSISFDSELDAEEYILNQIKNYKYIDDDEKTPETIRRLILSLFDYRDVKSVAVLNEKKGEFLLDIKKSYNLGGDTYFYSEVFDNNAYLIVRLMLIIKGVVNNYDVVARFPLKNPFENNKRKFDFLIFEIPIKYYWKSLVEPWEQEYIYGIPSRKNADWLFCQIGLLRTAPNGICVIITSKGTLVRSNEVPIRQSILEDDLIECVITLPERLHENLNIGKEIIIFNKNKPEKRKGKVLFINAKESGSKIVGNKYTISSNEIKKISDAYKEGKEETGFSKFVDKKKIEEYKYSLNPVEYLDFDTLNNSFKNSISLNEIANLTRGVQLTKDEAEGLNYEGTHYYINIKDIDDDNRINYFQAFKIIRKKESWIGKYDIAVNDILLTYKGSSIKVAIVEDDFEPSFVSGNLTRIRVNPKKYNPQVLYEFLRSDVAEKMMEGIQTGTKIKLINIPQLEKFEIPLMDKSEMDKIGDELKRNRQIYQKAIKQAKKKFETTREVYLKKLNFL